MDTIDIKRPVVIKVIMTPEFRTQLLTEAHETLQRLDENLNYVQEEGKRQLEKLVNTDIEKTRLLKSQMDFELDRLNQMKAELTLRMSQMENAQDGEEFPFRIFEGSVQVKVGDNLMEKVSKTEIVMKDWQVVEIRNA
jgi:predicted chitinase